MVCVRLMFDVAFCFFSISIDHMHMDEDIMKFLSVLSIEKWCFSIFFFCTPPLKCPWIYDSVLRPSTGLELKSFLLLRGNSNTHLSTDRPVLFKHWSFCFETLQFNGFCNGKLHWWAIVKTYTVNLHIPYWHAKNAWNIADWRVFHVTSRCFSGLTLFNPHPFSAIVPGSLSAFVAVLFYFTTSFLHF